MADSDPTATNTCYYYEDGGSTRTSGGSRTGDGDIDVGITIPGTYWFYIESSIGNDTRASSNIVRCVLTDGTDISLSEIEDGLYQASDLITFYPKVDTKTATGASARTWPTASGTGRGWVQPASSSERQRFMQAQLIVTHKILLAEDPGLGEGDRILWGATYMVVRGSKNACTTDELWILYVEQEL